jgi:hypothetical protein
MNLQLTDSKQYYLCSTSKMGTKMNGTMNSKIYYEIPRFITKSKNILYHSIKLIHAEIPYSFYIVNETNNKLSILEEEFTLINLTIPEGNYNAYTLLTVINDLFKSYNHPHIISLDNVTGKYTIESNKDFTILSTSSILKLIGGVLNTNYDATEINNNKYTFTFPYPVNLLGTKNIYIKCNNLILDNINTQTKDYQTLKSIPVNVPPYGLIMYNNNENIETLIKNQQTDYLNIELVDDDDNLINFNNQDWSITIELKTVLIVSYNSQTIDEYLNNNI